MPGDGRFAAVEETFTIAPAPRSRMPGSTAWVARTALITLICHERSQISSVSSSKRWISAQPTLLTRQSTRPNALERLDDHALGLAGAREVGRRRAARRGPRRRGSS